MPVISRDRTDVEVMHVATCPAGCALAVVAGGGFMLSTVPDTAAATGARGGVDVDIDVDAVGSLPSRNLAGAAVDMSVQQASGSPPRCSRNS